jgi:uncharacterized protein YgbK (DUF1537 family)
MNENLLTQIQAEHQRLNKPIIILDDDPTGSQTVHGVPILTDGSEASIRQEFERNTSVFFILTNSRSLNAAEADKLAFQIGKNIKATGRDCHVMYRGDSTLRGHFPNEMEALARGLGWNTEGCITALIPAFFEGNRFTKDDIHYFKNGKTWQPVGETPYAQDATFGYKNSDLTLWIEEKTKGKTKASEVTSFDTVSIMETQPEMIDNPANLLIRFEEKKLRTVSNKMVIVNALYPVNLQIFALAALRSERRILYRTAASFVAAFAAIAPKPLLTSSDLNVDLNKKGKKNGGLIVVGSHVPKTSAQLEELLKTDIHPIQFNVYQFFMSDARQFVSQLIVEIDELLRGGKNVVLYTSRNVVLGKNKDESLTLSGYVSGALVTIVQNLSVHPQFLVAKGGITSSDIAVKALKVKRAVGLGQIVAGVPVWQLGDEAKFPQLPYVIFPGNVGTDADLRTVYEILK